MDRPRVASAPRLHLDGAAIALLRIGARFVVFTRVALRSLDGQAARAGMVVRPEAAVQIEFDVPGVIVASVVIASGVAAVPGVLANIPVDGDFTRDRLLLAHGVEELPASILVAFAPGAARRIFVAPLYLLAGVGHRALARLEIDTALPVDAAGPAPLRLFFGACWDDGAPVRATVSSGSEGDGRVTSDEHTREHPSREGGTMAVDGEAHK